MPGFLCCTGGSIVGTGVLFHDVYALGAISANRNGACPGVLTLAYECWRMYLAAGECAAIYETERIRCNCLGTPRSTSTQRPSRSTR